MGTLLLESSADNDYEEKQEASIYNQAGCKLCPLAKIKENQNPDMPASGSERPLVYIIGEGPGAQEDEEGMQFVGKSGQFLRARIPREFKGKIRFNNVVRTRPKNNATPGFIEIECCRPSVERDIEQSKPKAIFGFGNVPLHWISGFHHIAAWRGRRMPVQVGSHTCWYYPMLHPSYVANYSKPDSENELTFTLDMKRAFGEINKLPPAKVHTLEEVKSGVELLKDLQSIKQALRWAASRPAIGFDYETNRLRPYEQGAKILTVGISDGRRTIAFPFDHPESPLNKRDRDDLKFVFKRFLIQCAARKAVHMLAFELEWSGYWFGVETVHAGRWEDTASQASSLDERSMKVKPGPLSLEFLVQQYFGFNLKKISNVDRAKLEFTPLDVVLLYNGLDAKYHLLLYTAQLHRIQEEGMEFVYELKRRRVPTVVLSQLKGCPVDQNEVQRLKKKYEERVANIEKEIAALPIIKKYKKIKGVDFSPTSNPDALYVFVEMLKRQECTVYDRKKRAERQSVEEEVLEKIDHPLSKLLVAHRKASRQLSTYIIPMVAGHKKTVVHPDGMIHTVFNTLFARTGRLSSDSPNMQNYPKRSEEGKEVRRAIAAGMISVLKNGYKRFVIKKGYVVVAIDYGQIEARVIAMATRDKRFCKALWEDFDVHMDWAERLAYAYPARIGGKKFLKDPKVLKTFRTDIKNQWTFPLFFGATLESAAGYLSIPPEAIKREYNQFWKEFSGVHDWQDELLESYKQNGYVETLNGTRRRAPLALNKVINSPIQGTAAEIVMDAMSRLSETKIWDLQPELNIHDDLTWISVPEEEVESHVEKALDIMLDVPFDFVNVPIMAEVSIGPNWADLHDEGKFSSDKWFAGRKKPSAKKELVHG